MAQVKLATVDEIPEGGMILKEHGHTQVLLAKVDGQVFAVDDACTHAGGPLHEGELGGESPFFVTCPWHAAQFDLRTGKVHSDTDWGSDCQAFAVEVRDGEVFVDL